MFGSFLDCLVSVGIALFLAAAFIQWVRFEINRPTREPDQQGIPIPAEPRLVKPPR